jgi:hypothetical protein
MDMDLLWFYIAVALALSDELHSKLFWSLFFDFYVVLAGLIQRIVGGSIRMWVVHEVLEAIFNFIVLSILFLSLPIGILAAAIHLVVDLFHEAMNLDLPPLEHRALHFVIESSFFILVLSLGIPG